MAPLHACTPREARRGEVRVLCVQQFRLASIVTHLMHSSVWPQQQGDAPQEPRPHRSCGNRPDQNRAAWSPWRVVNKARGVWDASLWRKQVKRILHFRKFNKRVSLTSVLFCTVKSAVAWCFWRAFLGAVTRVCGTNVVEGLLVSWRGVRARM